MPLRLITSTIEGLESRAQARRVSARLGEFRRAEIDFGGVTSVGHAFADELFRVFAPTQRSLELVPVNMTPAVAALIEPFAQRYGRVRGEGFDTSARTEIGDESVNPRSP